MSIDKLCLNGAWHIKQLDHLQDGKAVEINGTVPGVVHCDMVEQELVPDPFYRRNEVDQQWVGEASWQYTRNFDVTAGMLEKNSVILCCEGLDTIADVFVNDTKIASVDNMHITWRWDVKSILKVGQNEIKVVFNSLSDEMEKRRSEYWLDIPGISNAPWHPRYRQFIRKSHTHCGWDWGPAFSTPGIWRDIYVEAYDGAKLLNVTHQQVHKDGNVDLTVTAFFDCACAAGTLDVEVAGVTQQVKVEVCPETKSCKASLTVESPELWWPASHGEQNLYPMSVVYTDAKGTQEKAMKVGFRKCELVREKDEFGESFFFRINDVPIFAKGNNWIPSDSFDCRLEDDQIRWELESAVKANNNMIRIWGGGLYERDSFFEMCDELGLMVWHDFMFACHKYPVTKNFLQSVEVEVRQNMRRLMNHPSIVLWCGNNECEQAIQWGGPTADLKTITVEYDQLYIQTIMPIVDVEDPGRSYWPSSPSNGVRRYGDPQDRSQGDTHYWSVWHGNQPFSNYLEVVPRFSSEFGFQSFPAPELIDRYTEPEDRNITSRVMEHFQRSHEGNQKINNHICREFRVPVGWENTLYLSQVLQALSIKVACEHWRRIKPRNMGTLIWQLNDIWPGASWSSVDCEGRWKVMHYLERKFYAPLLVSAFANEETGETEIWGTSDINAELNGTLSMQLIDFAGKELFAKSLDVELGAQGSVKLAGFKLTDVVDEGMKEQVVLRISLEMGDYSSENSAQFAPSKYLELKKPTIDWSLSEDADGQITMTISSDTFTPYVWIRHGQIHGVWSNNGMHLYPGEKVTLTFDPRFDKPSVEELKQEIIIQDLYSAGF